MKREHKAAAWVAGAAALAVASTALVAATSVSGTAAPITTKSGPAKPAGAVVHTKDGALKGTVKKTYRSFQGIRYAAPAKRWVQATPAARWNGVRSATKPGSECVQEAVFWRPTTPASTDEDCLFLNVFTPAKAVENRPVLVFFHGGGGINGSATDVHPDRMASWGDNIVVSVNYRLGVLGGIDLPGLDAESADGKSGGNYANTDKIQALKWVQRNVKAFGGDPHRVMIGGQSAGAGATCFLLASPSAKGLFSAAGIQSAGSCGSASSQSAAYASGQKFATAAGCSDPATAVACLRELSAADILEVQAATGTGAGTVYGGRDLPVPPSEAFASGNFNKVPVIFGNVRNESHAFVYEGNDLVRQPVTPTSYVSQMNAQYGDDAAALLAEYPLSDYASPGLALAKVGTDDRVCGALPSAQSIAKWTPTFTYEFRDESAPLRPYMTVPPSFHIGSGHTSEVPYLWQSETATPLTGKQLRLSRLMIGYWSNLARTGTPNAKSLPNWPRFKAATGDKRTTFLAGGRTKVVSGASFAAEHHCQTWAALG